MGILPRHAPLMTSLEEGCARQAYSRRRGACAIHGGFMEVLQTSDGLACR